MVAIERGLVERGAELIIAACTEVPLLLGPEDSGVSLVDSTEALVRQLIVSATR
jgi:aspartate racemase